MDRDGGDSGCSIDSRRFNPYNSRQKFRQVSTYTRTGGVLVNPPVFYE
jgi:hypothetical protein